VHRFLIVVEKANGNCSAYSPDLPGCVATGKMDKNCTKSFGLQNVTYLQNVSCHCKFAMIDPCG